MTKVIRVVGFASGRPCPVGGLYLKSFDFDAANGLGYGEFTFDPADAMSFPDAGAALTFWNTQSKVRPNRSDGEPNRPLTCTTVEIVDDPHRHSTFRR
jgi:hypothetical protein